MRKGMFSLSSKGDYGKADEYFEELKDVFEDMSYLEQYGQMGVDCLAAATPKDTGKTAESWDYEIVDSEDRKKVVWTNSNVNGDFNVAKELQYGHGTGSGGWVPGQDYINPAMEPVFDEIVDAVVEEVTSI